MRVETEIAMAFGFFKKVETADLIFHNGHIFTQDSDLPWTEAVACLGDKIMGVGNLEGMDEIIGKNTRLVDLDGKFLLPGFIDVHRSPVLKVFDGKFADLSECASAEDVLAVVSDWAEENPDDEIIFGYGYSENLKPEDTEEAPSASAEFLSAACEERPILLLCASGIECWTNCAADEIIASTAEEECVQTVTTPYVLNLLIPFDFEQIECDVKEEIEVLSDHGFTSVLNLGTPDYFENLYQDSILGLYNEGEIRQRFFGSYFMNRPLVPQPLVKILMNRKTACIELNGFLNANMLNLFLDNENCPIPFSQEALNTILSEVSDKGFDIFVEAINREDMLMAYDSLEFTRGKGYKNNFIIASDFTLPEEEFSVRPAASEAITTCGTNLLADRSIYANAASAEEVIDRLTLEAARIIGMQDRLGAIKAGMLADFAIFEENPLDCEIKLIPRLHACMTVLGGNIVYDAESENDMEMFDLMMSQQY